MNAKAANATAANATTRFWLEDYRPLSGKLRAVIYLGLLYFAFFDLKSPILGIELYKATDPAWYQARGLAGVLGLSWTDPAILQLIIYAVIACWVAAGIGLFFRVTSVLTAAGVVFLHAQFLPTSAMNHAWYITTYTLVALCFSRPVDDFSVDSRLLKYVPKIPLSSLSTSGLCRKVMLVLVVAFYFSGGFSKLTIGGLAWMDGKTLQHALIRKSEVGPLGRWLGQHLWLCSAASVASFALELGAPLALWKRARIFMLLGWAAMHVGIRFTLGVFYDANCWCLLLLVDWSAIQTRCETSVSWTHAVPRSLVGLWAVPALWLAVGVSHVEWWPFTHVDMYSAYNTKQWNGGRPWWHYHRMPQVQTLARACVAGDCTRHAREIIASRVRYRLRGKHGHHDLAPGPGSHSNKHWARMVMVDAVLADMASKPDGSIADTGSGPATDLLQRSLDVLERSEHKLDGFDRVQLVYPLEGREVVMAQVFLR